MKKLSDKKLIKLYLWLGFAFLVMGTFYTSHIHTVKFLRALFNNLWSVAYLVPLNFIFFEYTFPFVLRKRKFHIYNVIIGVLLLWVHLMFWSYGSYAWRSIGLAVNIYTDLKSYPSLDRMVESRMAYSAESVFLFGIVRHIYNYTNLKQAAQQLRIQKQEAELNYLKSQTNPHFLFNTLNNIYSLARDKSDLAPESILRLSKMLRFMLYETGGAYIAIEQEIKIITEYIELEKLRYDQSLRININHDVEDMKQAIPPLLLIPLVENAFKHGVSETRGQPFVDIHLSVNKRKLMFVVKNSSEVSGERSVHENIGLSNLRRQLELLYTDSKLSVVQGESVFTASLYINLASHV